MYRVLEVSTQDRSPLEPVQVTVVPEVSVGGVVHCSNSNSFAGDNSNDGGVTSRSTHASDSRSGIQTLSPDLSGVSLARRRLSWSFFYRSLAFLSRAFS